MTDVQNVTNNGSDGKTTKVPPPTKTPSTPAPFSFLAYSFSGIGVSISSLLSTIIDTMHEQSNFLTMQQTDVTAGFAYTKSTATQTEAAGQEMSKDYKAQSKSELTQSITSGIQAGSTFMVGCLNLGMQKKYGGETDALGKYKSAITDRMAEPGSNAATIGNTTLTGDVQSRFDQMETRDYSKDYDIDKQRPVGTGVNAPTKSDRQIIDEYGGGNNRDQLKEISKRVSDAQKSVEGKAAHADNLVQTFNSFAQAATQSVNAGVQSKIKTSQASIKLVETTANVNKVYYQYFAQEMTSQASSNGQAENARNQSANQVYELLATMIRLNQAG